MSTFEPHKEILAPAQLAVWESFRGLPAGFVLYDGTALAMRLGHRVSVDFDFFSNRPFLPGELEAQIPWLAGTQRLQSAPNTLTCLVDQAAPVKISFFGNLKLGRVGRPEHPAGSGIWVASLLDLAATKVKAVQDRAEAKDYIDVAALLEQGITLSRGLGAAQAIYGEKFNPMLSLKALSFFDDGDLPALDRTIRDRLLEAVRTTDIPEIIVPPLLGGGVAGEDRA